MEPNFEEMNEADVCGEFVEPLIRQLGYRTGTENNVIRQQLLRYEFVFLGRKDPDGDPRVRGKADYILEAGRRVRWVIEAKAPQVPIDEAAVEQAWSYANHPEVRAAYAVVYNGRELAVYRTSDGPQAKPKLRIIHDEMAVHQQTLANLLEPAAICRDFPDYAPDFGKPIAKGLRSLVRVTRGLVTYTGSSIPLSILKELSAWIVDGSVQRDKEGRLLAFLKTVSPFRSIQHLNERLGFADFEMASTDSQLSSDPTRPTVFTYDNRLVFPAGTEILDVYSWKLIELVQDLPCELKATASGTYQAHEFRGTFRADLRYPMLALTLDGAFEIHLA